MKILIIDNFSTNFGTSILSAVLKKAGHEVVLQNYKLSKWKGIDQYTNPQKYFPFDKISESAIETTPDVIFFSVFSANYMFYKHTAEAIRHKTDIPILIGGVLPTLAPDLFMNDSCCDYLFRGDGEPVILDLIEKISNGKYQDVPNLVYRGETGEIIKNEMTSFVKNVNEIPFYDKHLYPDCFDSMLRVFSSRGCPLACAYCSAGAYSKVVAMPGEKTVRKRTVDNVIEEIKEALEIRPYKDIYFYDDFFITTKQWMSEFAEKYKKEINLPYSCLAFPASVAKKEIPALLAESGCKFISMGFQTANDEYKKKVLRRNETNAMVVTAMRNLDEVGIKYALDHIFNLPGETREHVKESLDFYVDNNFRDNSRRSLTIYFLNYYPDSPFVTYANENGYFTSEQYSKIMKNEMLGEQSFKGTILDEKKAKEQVQYALLFRMISLLPGKWIKMMFKNNIQKFFPTNKYLYYFTSVVTTLRLIGMNKLQYVLKITPK